ncbi:hypothetical protein K2X89_00630 [Myxococcota bacterium]|nr:hypothetical protein [Myxococcota bacterium]
MKSRSISKGFPASVGGRSGRLLAALVAAGLGLLASESAGAGGFGGSLSYTRSQSKLDDIDDFWADLNTESDEVGFGLVFDTNLARDRLFNYRLNASLAFVDEEVGQAGLENQVQGTNVSLDQTFGFGFIRTPSLRVFVGPSLHLGVGRIDDNIHVSGFRENYERTSFTAGLGPELGMNFHVGRHLTFSTSAFVRYGFQVQSFQRLFDEGRSDGDFVGGDLRAGLVTSIFFRFGGDQFAAVEEGWGGD